MNLLELQSGHLKASYTNLEHPGNLADLPRPTGSLPSKGFCDMESLSISYTAFWSHSSLPLTHLRSPAFPPIELCALFFLLTHEVPLFVLPYAFVWWLLLEHAWSARGHTLNKKRILPPPSAAINCSFLGGTLSPPAQNELCSLTSIVNQESTPQKASLKEWGPEFRSPAPT